MYAGWEGQWERVTQADSPLSMELEMGLDLMMLRS